MTNEVVATQPMITNDEETMRNITSFRDAMDVLHSAGVNVTDYSAEFGDGFSMVEKASLVGVPFVILGIKFAAGDFGEPFAIVHGVTEPGTKFVITDGSTGLRKQCQGITEAGITSGVYVKGGLTRSDYVHVDEKGKETPATTFYLAQ